MTETVLARLLCLRDIIVATFCVVCIPSWSLRVPTSKFRMPLAILHCLASSCQILLPPVDGVGDLINVHLCSHVIENPS